MKLGVSIWPFVVIATLFVVGCEEQPGVMILQGNTINSTTIGSDDGTGGWTNTTINTSTRLDVFINGSLLITDDSADNYIHLRDGATREVILRGVNPVQSSAAVGTTSGHDFSLLTTNSTRMYIRSGGDVIIGTSNSGLYYNASNKFTGIGTNVAKTRLDVNGSANVSSTLYTPQVKFVSTSSVACNSGNEGTTGYNYTSHKLMYCNSTSWVSI